MPKQRRKIGDLGEHSFTVWCSQLGMDAVKAVPDRNGWDYLVEFERRERMGLPPDAQHNLIKAYFQIKSTEKSNSSMLGKLSAFKALVSADAPAFVVKFEFGNESQPTRCRLLHIGEPQIAAVLKRVREAHRDEAELHKINFSLPLDGARTVEFGSEELRDYIEGCVGSDPPPLNWSTLKYVFWQTGGPQCRRSATSPKRSSRSCARSMCSFRRANPLPTRSVRSA